MLPFVKGSRFQPAQRSRSLWAEQTMLCITHDVGETRGFERVLVIEEGRLVEDGAPAQLVETSGSRYRARFESRSAHDRPSSQGAAAVAPPVGRPL